MPVLAQPPPLPVRRAAIIARWKPPHLGHAAVLRALGGAAEEVLVGIGSANRATPPPTAGRCRSPTSARASTSRRPTPGFCAAPPAARATRWTASVGDRVCLEREALLAALNLLEAVAAELPERSEPVL